MEIFELGTREPTVLSTALVQPSNSPMIAAYRVAAAASFAGLAGVEVD
jgi:hypothetical protein